MNTNAPINPARAARLSASPNAGILEASAAQTVNGLLDADSVGLLSAGIDPQSLLRALLGSADLRALLERDGNALFARVIFPQAAKRKVEEDEDGEDEEGTDDDEVVDDDEEEDEDEEEDDLDEEEEDDEDDEDEDEDEEDDEFDDPDDDDDDDFDDDDDEDFDEDE
jgi:hypothetical protein